MNVYTYPQTHIYINIDYFLDILESTVDYINGAFTSPEILRGVRCIVNDGVQVTHIDM